MYADTIDYTGLIFHLHFIGQKEQLHVAPASEDSPGCIMAASTQKYPEFNSTSLGTTIPRRIRLYQVAAIINTREFYTDISDVQLSNWIKTYKVEASHLCRYVDEGSIVTFPDGSTKSCPIIKENSKCFQIEHLILEPQAYNRTRINCKGGEACLHVPKCILVAKPQI